ncbi:MAG: MFS transporter, partial [Alphaproteobacteria bacterium]|nr:MFS transporter [Alphaproteobacteria bacterium]
LPAFVVSRFLQGMGGAMMTPVGRLVLVRSTPKSELVAAMSWLTVPALVGPPIGGFITTYFTWHWIFLINVPLGLAGMWLATRYLPKTAPVETPPLDFPGFVLSGLAASGVVFGLSVVSLPALPPITGFITVAVGVVSGVFYLIHARRAKNPLLALELFRNQVFRSSVLGGSLFRIGIGAVPFLLPLMFQIGFGLTPFQSGMITFVSAVGAIGMKFVTALLFRLAGFRRVLIWGSLIAAGSIAIYGLFTPETPYALMLAILLVGGFIRSMFFTGVNALSYAEISAEDTSKATPITAVFQQLSIALGVALAGGILEVSTSIHGGPLTLGDFHIAFFIVAAVSAAASITFMRLTPDAGSAVSGHGRLATPKTLESVGSAGK